MKAVPPTNDLYRLWPKLSKYGRAPKGAIGLYNLATSTQSNGVYADIPRAIVCDPIYGHTTGGKAYVTHSMGSTMAFNLGYTDGSVRTARIKSSTVLPNSGEYKQIISAVQYLEAVLGGGATPGSYDYATGEYAKIPQLP